MHNALQMKSTVTKQWKMACGENYYSLLTQTVTKVHFGCHSLHFTMHE